MSYSDLLRDPRWQRKRLETLQAAGWACSNCGDKTKTLHVHHLKYRRGAKPWEYEADELRSLCEKCHDDATEAIRNLDEAVDGIKVMGDPGWIEMAIGYLRALRGAAEEEIIIVDNYEQAMGVSHALGGGRAEEVLDSLVDGKLDAGALQMKWFDGPGVG